MIPHFTAACLLAFSASAAAHPALDAIRATDKNSLYDLHYRTVQTSTTSGKTSKTIASYDPAAPVDTRWTLESIDGHVPSATETAEFRKRKKSVDDSKLGELVDPASLELLEGGGQARRWRFRFRQGRQLDGISLDKFSGIVTLGETGQASAIDVILDESMRMKAVVKIARMRQHIDYARLPNGDLVARSSDTEMEGSAAFLALKLSSHTSYELIKPSNGS
jgi:hypothetical protein